jgi:hypothetical protein
MIGPRSHVSFGTWKRVEKGFIPLGWALTLFEVENSHVMEWSIWWCIDSENRAFCSNYMYTFRRFSWIKNDIKIDKITIVHELYYFTCNLYSNIFSLKYITQWLKIQKIRSFLHFLPSSVFNTALTGKSLPCKNNKITIVVHELY